jgi:EAL domain-containing protein (putative c-di-GMP-specific phosphodiesterase class I)
MADPASAEWISNKVQEYQLDSKCIVFEIAERCAANNLVNAKTFVTAMQNLGCRIAVEHFGLVDHAQLLKHIDADIIKIDGTLIGQLRNNKDVEKKIKSIIDAARENEIICIAECVDDANLLALLWQNGVDYIQGYFVQEPDKELGYEFESEIV